MPAEGVAIKRCIQKIWARNELNYLHTAGESEPIKAKRREAPEASVKSRKIYILLLLFLEPKD